MGRVNLFPFFMLMKKKLTHGSLFSGIGGFELGAKRSGINTIWNCEINQKNRIILKKHFKKTEQYEDITRMQQPRYVDIISGGFPCQDISVAGTMDGINGSRSGLWAEMFRICCEVRPKFIIIENSPALTFSGLDRILCDIAKIGYNAEWQCLSNHMFGYPHKRERIYIIAYSNKIGLQSRICENRRFNSIFRKPSPKKDIGYSYAERIYKMPNHYAIRDNNGFRHWSHRSGSIGNSVNPTIAHYLFECIKNFNQQ